MQINGTFLNADTRLIVDSTAKINVSNQLSSMRRLYVNSETGKTVDLEKLVHAANESVPLTLPYRDAEGNLLQLWSTRKYGLIGAAINPQGCLSIISSENIRNPANPAQTSSELLEALTSSKSKQWVLALDVTRLALTIWPHISAAGDKVRPIVVEASPFRHASEKDFKSYLKHQGFTPAKNDPNVYVHRSGQITAHLDREGQGNHVHAEGFKGTHVDFRVRPELARAMREERENKNNESIANKRQDLDQQVKTGKLSQRDADNQMHAFKKEIHANNEEYNSFRAKWRFAYDQERPKDQAGGRQNPQNPSGNRDPAGQEFLQKLQQLRLTDSYNSTHQQNPVPPKGATGGDIGGVACSTAYIEGLFDGPEALFERDHVFCVPGLPDGKLPFSNDELRQIAREVAIGTYVHGAAPFFSLHFNQNKDQFPVIHPAYENTLVGRVISMLDYMMKGYLNGGVFNDKFIDEWHMNPDWKTKSDSALKNLIDFNEYCQKYLSGSDKNYKSLRMCQSEFALLGNPNIMEEAAEKLGVALGVVTEENPVLKKYSGFRNSFRIISKQKSIKKEGNVFLIDADFDVQYTISPSPEYKAALDEHFRKHGTLPTSYANMDAVYKAFCERMHDHMAKLPMFRNYFAMLSVIDFFSGYFCTLKKYRKVPVLPALQPTSVMGCPPLFPHLPISSAVLETLQLNMHAVLNTIIQKHKSKLQTYFTQLHAYLLAVGRKPTAEEKNVVLAAFKLEIQNNIIKSSSLLMRRVVEQKVKTDEHIQKMINDFAALLVHKIKELMQAQIKDLSTNFLEKVPDMCEEATLIAILNEAINSNRKEFERFFSQIHKDLLVPSPYENSNSIVLSAIGKAVRRHLQRPRESAAGDLLEHLRTNFESMVGRITSCFELIPKIYEDKLKDFAKVPITEARLKSELEPEEVERGIKLVGGCGVHLEVQAIQTSRLASQILRSQWRKFQTMKPETWTEIPLNNGQSKGFAFRLPIEDVPAWVNDNYEWMESLLLVPNGTEAVLLEERLAIQEAMTSGQKQAFTKLVDGSKKLSEMKDRYQRTLLHHAACVSDPFYTTHLLNKGLSASATDVHGFIPLHYSAMNGADDTLRALLKVNSQHIDATSRNGSTSTIVAIQHGQQSTVQLLLRRGASPHTLSGGYTTLHCALHHGDFTIIHDVLANPKIVAAEINQLSEEGGTPLTLACELDSAELVAKMISLNADPKIKRQDGVSATTVAIRRDCIPVVACLLKHVTPSAYDFETVAKEGSVGMIKLVASLPAFYTHRSTYKDTTLHSAMRFGNLPGALFIATTCNDATYLSAENEGKETAFSLAAALGAWDLIEELIKKKSVSKQTIAASMQQLLKADYNPYLKQLFDLYKFDAKDLKIYAQMAAQAGNHQALSFIFVPLQVNLDAIVGPNDWRIAHYLAKSDGLALFRTTIIRNKNFLQPLQKEDGKTLLYIAGLNRSLRVLRLILEQMKKGNVSLERHYKDRHLFYAVLQSGSIQCVRIFLEIYQEKKKELANTVLDGSGLRPVHLAAKMGSLGTVKLLIGEGADPKAVDGNGDNALCHAFKASATATVNYLLKEFGSALITSQALLVAASQRLQSHLELLMKLNPSQEILNQSLFLAVQACDTMAFTRLQASGATFNFVRNDGMTSLLLASATGQSALLSLILKDKTLTHTFVNGNNALHEAARNRQIHCVNILMAAGYQNVANQKGKSALELSGNSQGLKLLVTKREAYTKSVTEFATLVLKKENVPKLVSEINASPLNEPIQIEYDDEIIWGTPFQLLLRIHKKDISVNDIKLILQREDLDPNLHDSDGNTLAHLLLRADIFPKVHQPVNWTLTNKEKEIPLHVAARFCSLKTFQLVLADLVRLNLLHLVNATDRLGRTPIFDAVDARKEANIKLLANAGAFLDHYDYHLMTPLIVSCINPTPSLAIIKLILSLGADPNQIGTIKRVSPLQVAVGMDRDEIARCLLFNGANCQVTARGNTNLVHATAQSGNSHLLRLFVAKGLSIDSRDDNGLFPIHHAAFSGETDMVKAVLSMQRNMLNAAVERPKEHMQKVEKEDSEQAAKYMEGATPLFLSAAHNKPETMQFLLKQQANTETETKQNSNVLSFVASKGSKSTLDLFLPYKLSRDPKIICKALGQAIAGDNLDIVIPLYDRGVPINAEIINGFTGIQLAAQQGSLLSTQWLLQNGAEALLPGPTGEDALQLSAANDSWSQFSLILEYVEPDLNELRNNRETLLHTTTKAGNLMHVMLLLSHQASINIKDSRGNLPIHWAVQNGHANVAHLLLACGADVSEKAPNGKSLQELVPVNDKAMQKVIQDFALALSQSAKKQDSQLHFAVRCKNPQAVLLQTHLQAVDKTNAEGATALHIAVEMDQEDSCMHLVLAGANVSAKDKAGRTPLSIAKAKNTALVEMLVQAGAK